MDGKKIWPEVKTAMEKFKENKKQRIDSFFPRSSKFRSNKKDEPKLVGIYFEIFNKKKIIKHLFLK